MKSYYDKSSLATTRYPHTTILIDPNQKFPVRWMSTNSVHYVECPKCGAKPTFLCVTPSGRPGRSLTGGAHGERMLALQEQRPEIAALSKVNVSAVKP